MNGFTTLNRLLGKKNKDGLSKSKSDLSRSMTNLNSSQNQIVQLPVLNNAPFEQTFRITVCMPHDQLYVARLGAKTNLSKLLEMVCQDKDLDRDKYEFRHPADNSNVFHGSLTIGEVGLNELRLASKTETYHNDNFNTDEIIKLRSANRDSMSSSDLSRNSKQFLKTTSPYSSTNSLNSMDSSGMSSSSRSNPPVAPLRKKRTAPRPPSQNSIPEQKIDCSQTDINFNQFKEPLPVLPRKNFHVSSPNLVNHNYVNVPITVNGEHKTNGDTNYSSANEDEPMQRNQINRPISMNVLYNENNNRFSYNGGSQPDVHNHSRTSSDCSENKDGPEPVPRKRLFAGKKKAAPPAPAPPPRGLSNGVTAVVPPVPTPRKPDELHKNGHDVDESDYSDVVTERVQFNQVVEDIKPKEIPQKPEPQVQQKIEIEKIPETPKQEPQKSPSPPSTPPSPQTNISKVMLNVEETNPQIIETASTLVDEIITETKTIVVERATEMVDEIITKIESDESGIYSAPVSDVDLILKDLDADLEEEKSSDDDSEVNVYNIKLGKPIVVVEKSRTPSPLWTYTLPAPANFADKSGTILTENESIVTDNKFYNDYDDRLTILSDSTTVVSDVDIQPIINQRDNKLYLNGDSLILDDSSSSTDIITSDIEDGYQGDKLKQNREVLLENLEKHKEKLIECEIGRLNDENRKNSEKSQVLEELSTVISTNHLNHHETNDFKDINRNSIKNFHMSSYHNNYDDVVTATTTTPTTAVENEVFEKNLENERKNSEEIVLKKPREFLQVRRRSSTQNGINRSESFHSTTIAEMKRNSITNLDNLSNFESLMKRRSSSELSIEKSPSLQSLEVLKTILPNLNSRKNSQEEVVVEKKSESSQEEIVAEKNEPKWKYQGPPKINLSSWSERPKVEVSIKSDKDYKFGGSSTLPRGYKNVDKKKDEEINKLPIVRSVELKKREVEEEEPVLRNPSFYSTFSKPKEVTTTPVVQPSNPLRHTIGFLTVREPETPEIPVLKKQSFRISSYTESKNEFPFSQNTLRRTGLKDRILETEKPKEIPKIVPKIQLKQTEINHKPEPLRSISLTDEIKSQKIPPPPPPKLAPIVRAVVVKKQISVQADPRDQLLDSIRNFSFKKK